MGFTGVTISGPETLRHRVARAIWQHRPDSQGKTWPLETPTSARAYLHNPVASVDLSFMYADAAIEAFHKQVRADQIEAGKSPASGWSKDTLAAWGVSWPPAKGWREALIDGKPVPQPGSEELPASAARPSACVEAKLLHEVVMAVISAGQGDLLKGIDALNDYYGCPLPTVEQVLGSRPEHAIVTGGIAFDDKVYSFTCARSLSERQESTS